MMKDVLRHRASTALAAVSILLTAMAAVISGSPAQAAYSWKSVVIGGGGFVTGIAIHPTVPNVVYIRTDVSGCFRYNPATNDWTSITDWATNDQQNYYGGEGIAIDPGNANVVWMAAGMYEWGGDGVIFKSTNQGTTWTQSNPAGWGVQMGGNENWRWSGERLLVDPFNSSIVLFASRNNGLWKTQDGGATWFQPSFPNWGTAGRGLTSLAFDPTSSGVVFAVVGGVGVYRSADHGATWTSIGGPSDVSRIAARGGIAWASTGSGASKYSGGSWTNYLPAGSADSYNGISINPSNVNDVICATDNSCTCAGARIFRTSNGGGSWTQQTKTDSAAGPWFSLWGHINMLATAFIEFDPAVSGRAWLGDWYATYHTDNVNASTVAWSNNEKGREALVSFCAIGPPTGADALTGHADNDGFYHNNGIDNFPSSSWGQVQDTHGIDWSGTNASLMVRCGYDRWQANGHVYTSSDGGQTWNNCNGWNSGGDSHPSRVALSATSGSNFVVATNGISAKYTTDGGASFANCNGLPAWANDDWTGVQHLAADRVNGGTFYYYDSGNFYRSTDGGANFSIVASGLPSTWTAYLYSVQGIAGELWLSLENNGIWTSTNGGSTWTQKPGITRALMGAPGKPVVGSVPSVYVYGRVSGDTTDKIYQSNDRGSTWTNIQDPNVPIGDSPMFMDASWKTAGLVFVGTNGRGVYQGTPVAGPPAPTGLTATAGNSQLMLSWGASSGATSYNVKRSTVSGSGYATVSSPATTSYTNTGLTNGTTYYFVVTAVNSSGESGNSNEVSAQPFAPVPQAQIASGTAVIDGVVDAAWSAATSYPLTKTTGTISSSADCSASWQGLWDATNLYILVNVTDDVKINDSVNPWDDDAVELYLDADHNGGTTYDANDRQIVFGWNDAAAVEGGGRGITGVTFAKADPTGTTYRIEAKIPWSVEAYTPAANNLIGIDVHIDDDDDGGARDGKVIWTDGTDQAWNNPSLFGTGKLVANAAPPVPTGLAATAGNAQVALTWNASTGATTYNVKRSTVSGSGYATVSSPATTSYTNTGLTNGTTYYFVVSAVNANGESANSSQASAMPIAPPAAPSGLTAVPGIAQAWLTWNSSTGAATYNVKRSTVSGSGYATVSSPATTYFMNTGLTNGTTYYYVVTAVNGGGESGNSAQASAAPSATVPQAQIAPGTATIDGTVDAAWSSATTYLCSKTTGTISGYADCTATWQAMWDTTNLYILATVIDDAKVNDSVNVYDDDAVEVYLDADHNGGTAYDANDRQVMFGWGDTTPVEGGSRSITGVTFAKADPTSTSYRIEAKIPWAVEAFTPTSNAIVGIDVHIDDDDDGGARDGKVIWNDGTDQAWTNPSLFGAGKLTGGVSIPPAPTGLAATAGNTQVTLSWTASSGATSYNVKRSTVSGSGYVTVSSPTTTTYTNTGLTNGTTYYYVVTAVNSAGESGNSNQASAIPIDPNVHTGTWALKGVMTTTISFKNTYQSPTGVATNSTYTASFWLKGTGIVQLRVNAGNWGAELLRLNYTATSTWTLCTTTFSTGANTQLTYVLDDGGGTAGTLYVDDAFLGIANGTNLLVNPGFEGGAASGWTVDAAPPWTIVQNP